MERVYLLMAGESPGYERDIPSYRMTIKSAALFLVSGGGRFHSAGFFFFDIDALNFLRMLPYCFVFYFVGPFWN